MGKNYCKVDKKWCKFLQRGICQKAECEIGSVNRCPRLAAIETVRLYDILKEVSFEHVFKKLCYWFTDQESSKEGYYDVFNKLRLMIPLKHNLTDLFIEVDKVYEDDGTVWLNVSGKDMINQNGKSYGIEFSPWNEWVSMFITQETLDNLTKEDIVAGCLYEMTFFGFTEQDVQDEKQTLIDSVEECKEQLKNDKK